MCCSTTFNDDDVFIMTARGEPPVPVDQDDEL
jgi:hypothetical protein